MNYSWDEIIKKADDIFEELVDKNYSAQDISHIGLRLMHLGSFLWIGKGHQYLNGKDEEKRMVRK